jgi:hypothetical protein
MADRSIINIITPATTIDLITLDELKTWLGLSLTDTSLDVQLSQMITWSSALCAELCNRTFAQEELVEVWREIGNGRLFMSHWPIKQAADITNIVIGTDATPLDPSGYELEPASGKLSVIAGGAPGQWQAPVQVTYTGGYVLPNEAPLPLKQACVMIIREERMRNMQASVAGIRQISHREARVAFFDPNAVLRYTMGQRAPVQTAAAMLLRQFTRDEV